ncbi:MAG: hypothetical protein KF802_12065 [Bdellovibrionaceae bacterium]|nr:hypothetical protein [Pseudobdellovibrionaceae bacterium]MBX3032850.1 hypothetical protein [Pseudobdellovibrionaceae bacterium]
MKLHALARSALLGLLFFAPPSLAQEFPSDWRFVTLRTPHFEVIVNAEQQEMGLLYARKLEKAYQSVAPLFTDVPERTIVVLADKTDLTNGYATRLPYNHLFIYPVLPGPQDSLGEGGDWILELVAHEFTHVLTFEAVSGTMEPLQSVFGTILSPNLLLPRWWKEGAAVQVESMVSKGGRLRSAYQDGAIRTFVQNRELGRFDLARINEPLPHWPEGMSAYLFGSIFWSEAVAQKGKAVLDQLHQRHGGRVPYFVEAPARDLLGANYESFYATAMAEAERRARAQLDQLQRVPFAEGESLRGQAQYSQGPQVSPDGERLAFISVDETDRRSIRIFRRRTPSSSFVDGIEEERFVNRREDSVQPATKDAPPSGSISRVSWFPDGRKLVFDKVDLVSRYESYSDLWLFDLDTEKSSRLTRGLRAREPFVSRDGKSVLFVGLEGARTHVSRWDIAAQKATTVWRGDWQERASFPVELADGSVVFSVRSPDAWEGLRRLRPGETHAEVILDDFPNARFALPTSRGLVFTSSLNGVHNLYLASDDFLTAKPLSHVAGSAFSTGFDPRTGDLYTTLLTAQGQRVHRLPAGAAVLPESLPKVQPLFADRYPVPPQDPPDPDVAVEKSAYRPASYLMPRYWIPFISLSAVNNSLVIDASTSAFDPLKKHVYSLAGSWDSGLKEASYAAAYQNNVWPVSAQASAARNATYLVSTNDPVFNEVQSLSFQPDLFKVNRYLSASLGWNWRKTSYHDSEARRSGPALLAMYADYGRSGLQISPEEGGYLLGGANHYVPARDHIHYTQYLLSGAGYWSKWLPKRHALMARLNSVYTQERIGAIYGASTTNYFFQPDPAVPLYVMRGYRVGHFFGKTVTNANFEYRLPLQEIQRGSGTDPFYLTRLTGALFADVVSLDGFAYRPREEIFEAVRSNRFFASTGFEARLETTIGYFLPMNFILGAALPSSAAHSDGASLIMALQMGALF